MPMHLSWCIDPKVNYFRVPFAVMHEQMLLLKLTFRQYPGIHTNYIIPHCTRLVLKCGLAHLNANAYARDESNANANANTLHLNQMQMRRAESTANAFESNANAFISNANVIL